MTVTFFLSPLVLAAVLHVVTIMSISRFPHEIVVEILLFAAYRSPECARALSLTSSWTRDLVKGALYSTISLTHTNKFEGLFTALDISKTSFPKQIPVIDLFRLSFDKIPGLSPTRFARDRAQLIQNLWLIPLDAQERHARVEDHIYIRLVLQLCWNVQRLAITGTALSHFLMNKPEHFDSVRNANTDTVASGHCPYPHLKQLTLLDSTPALIMDGQYTRANECVQIFKQLTHFTTYGFYHRDGLPVPISHFTSLTHLALPLVLNNSVIHEVRHLNTEEIFESTGGWGLLRSAPQLQMVVFLFPSDGRLNIGSHVSTLYFYHDPASLVWTANRVDSKAYALPIDGLPGLCGQWTTAARGGTSIWELAKQTLMQKNDLIPIPM